MRTKLSGSIQNPFMLEIRAKCCKLPTRYWTHNFKDKIVFKCEWCGKKQIFNIRPPCKCEQVLTTKS